MSSAGDEVTRLRVRADWAVMRIALPPFFIAASLFTKIKFLRVLLALRAKSKVLLGALGVRELRRWGHWVEEFVSLDTLLVIGDRHLVFEDGGPPREVPLERITGIMIRQHSLAYHGRWSRMWRPPYWLEIQYLDETKDGLDYHGIEVWPRKVEGGLMRLRRFARALEGRVAALRPDGPMAP